MAKKTENESACITTLISDIKNRTFKKAYCLAGEEAYLRALYSRTLQDAILGRDTMNLSIFDGPKPDTGAIIRTGRTLPFLSQWRMVIVRDSGLLKSDAAPLPESLGMMPGSTIFLFDEPAIDKRNRLFKQIVKLGLFVPCDRQRPEKLKEWAAREFKTAGKEINGKALDDFIYLTGDDMVSISNEIEKVIAYTKDRDKISPADIRAVVSARLSSRIFEMIDFAASGKKREAMARYADLVALREPPLRIIYLLSRHLVALSNAKRLAAACASNERIGTALKIPSWAVRRYVAQAGRFSQDALDSFLELAADIECRIKTGNLSDTAGAGIIINRLLAAGQE